MANTLVQNDPHLDIPPIRPGIYLDGVNRAMIDVGGNNVAVSDGQVMLINNTAKVFGRGNGVIEWLQVDTDTSVSDTYSSVTNALVYRKCPTATVRVRYNCLDATTTGGVPDWDTTMNYFVGDPETVSTEWEWNCNNTITAVKVYRGAYDIQSGWIQADMPSVAERIKRIIADRCAPNFIRDRKALDFCPDIREIRARQTLRRVIGEDKFRDFIRKGFVSVRGKSGKFYQIFPGHGITSVYFCGKMVERLCVVMSGNFPPTDSLIMRYLLILNNEDQFRSLANVSGPSVAYKVIPKEPDKRTLVEIFAAFKNPLKKAA